MPITTQTRFFQIPPPRQKLHGRGHFQAVLIIAVGVISGPFFDRGYYSHFALRGEFFRGFWYDDVEFG